jgi:hypothetical protein
MMPADPFSALSFIAGPAILTNACATMQNGATTRYGLAVTQWREFSASLAAGDKRLSLLFAEPGEVVSLADRRVRLQLRALGLLNVAVALFGATTALGLAGPLLVYLDYVSSGPVSLVMVIAGTSGFACLLAATATFMFESACGRAMLALHHHSTRAPDPGRRRKRPAI